MILMFHTTPDKLATRSAAGDVGGVQVNDEQTTHRIDEHMSRPGLDRLAPSKLDATDEPGVSLRLSPMVIATLGSGYRLFCRRRSAWRAALLCSSYPLCVHILRLSSERERVNPLASSAREALLGSDKGRHSGFPEDSISAGVRSYHGTARSRSIRRSLNLRPKDRSDSVHRFELVPQPF
jgi:hypothetical protein